MTNIIPNNVSIISQVCFLTVSNFTGLGTRLQLPVTLASRVTTLDSLTFVVARWFQPHPSAHHRDEQHRPVCPGPLSINHCLWRFAIAPRPRQSLILPNGSETPAFRNQFRVFGNSLQEARERLEQEKRAYYCLLHTDNILHKTNMCPVFLPNTCIPDTNTWLQTVTLI